MDEDKMDLRMDDAADSPPASAQAITTPTSATAAGASGLEAKYSCVVCHARKVKCNRARPCSNCVRNAVDCEYKAPPPPRRGKKKSSAGAGPGPGGSVVGPFTAATLAGGAGEAQPGASSAGGTPRGARKYEEQRRRSRVIEDERGERASTESSGLRTFGERADRSVSGESVRGEKGEVAQMKAEEGTLLVDGESSRYLENNLWVTLSGELSNPRPFIQDQAEGATEDESSQATIDTSPTAAIIFGQVTRDDPVSLYPRADVVMALWRTFLRNVDPLSKMIHPPSFERVVQLSCQNIHAISRSKLALLYSIFMSAVVSMTDDECRAKIGNARPNMLKRFSCLTQKCLSRAGLLRTADLTLLTAFMYYLLSMRLDSDPQTVWSLSALALRTSQRIGLHRDNTDGLTPFEIEMRRRIWRQVLIFEWSTSEIAGSSAQASFFTESMDFDDPRNLNDTDMDPAMTEAPPSRNEATDMIFCMLRYQFSRFFKISHGEGLAAGGPLSSLSLAEKDQYIDDMERGVESRFLQYCDPIDPVHSLVTIVARAALTSMRIRAHHPRQYPDGGAHLPEEERARLFEWSFRALKYDNMAISNPALRGFHWHIRSFFQYHPVIYILTWVREKRVGDEVEGVWRELDATYRNRPELVERRVGLHVALAMLALQAWDAREEELARRDMPVEVPEFITNLRARALAGSSAGAMARQRRVDRQARLLQEQQQMQVAQQQQQQAAQQAQQQQQQAVLGGLPRTSGGEWVFAPGAATGPTATAGLNVMDFGMRGDMSATLDWAQWDQLVLQNPEIQLHQDFAFNALDGFFVPMQN